MINTRSLFLLMFAIFLLLNVDYAILKSVRSTLAVVDMGGSAKVIPIFELLGALPASIVMTAGLSFCLKRFSMQKVFYMTLALFLGFFLLFVSVIYPFLTALKHHGLILQLFAMTFYVMGELWKPALGIILFWGLLNQHMPLDEAKKLYAPLMLGGSVGAILAGPLVSLCTSLADWQGAITLMIFIVSFLGIVAAGLYHRLCRLFTAHTPSQKAPTSSLKESLLICMQNQELKLLGWIVIADYIAYSLGEVIFLDVLKCKFPKSCDYCNYLALLSSWIGVLTILSALFVAPFILRRCRWTIAALVTPLCVLVTEGAFFLFLRSGTNGEWLTLVEGEWITLVVFLGSLQYCLCRAAKYTFFDPSKELVFIKMPFSLKVDGKLIIDGVCSRFGRAVASALSISLISFCGGVIPSSLPAGICALTLAFSWTLSTRKLGSLLERKEVSIQSK